MSFFESTWFWGIVSLISAFVFFYMNKSTNDEKLHLLAMYKLTQNSSKRVQEKIKILITNYGVGNDKAFVNRDITYLAYLEMLEEDYKKSLSEETFERLKKDKSFKKPTLDSMIQMITKHSEEFRVIETELDVIIKKYKGDF